MIGVVVWSKEDIGQAAIWCQDDASIAFLKSRDDMSNEDVWPKAGELVELDHEMVGSTRYARNVSRMPSQAQADSPKTLSCAHRPDCTSLAFPLCEYTSPDCKQRCG